MSRPVVQQGVKGQRSRLGAVSQLPGRQRKLVTISETPAQAGDCHHEGELGMKLSGQCGFSLVELSIVLVILGLLVGGVLSGRSLIRAAELRNVPLEYQKFQAAVFTFQHQYGEKPGDFRLATRFWGNAETGGNDGDCSAAGMMEAITDSKQTCNGNGNGRIDGNERFRFWQHLANAGLIEGSYTGVRGSGSPTLPHHEIGRNCPASRVSGAGWGISQLTPEPQHWSAPDTNQQSAYLGGQSATSLPTAAIFDAKEVWNVDQKLDDGKPGTGLVRTRTWQCSSAATRDDYETAEYNFNINRKCVMNFYGMY